MGIIKKTKFKLEYRDLILIEKSLPMNNFSKLG
jgi:hypothetical protein